MATVFDVADYFLDKQNMDMGDTISNMKLQKLCYYAQGFTIAILGHTLFDETLQAWKYGPVCPVLYDKYACYGSRSIPKPERNTKDIYKAFTDDELDVMGQVHDQYGQYSAWRLSEFTHEESPWINNYHGEESREDISYIDMKTFFLTQLRHVED